MGGTPPPFPGHHVLNPGRSSYSPNGQGSERNLVRSCGGTCPALCGPHSAVNTLGSRLRPASSV